MRCFSEIDHDRGIACGQTLAGTDVKRHTGPAPVGNLAAQSDKRFRLAVGVDTGFLPVARHSLPINRTRAVLPANHVLAQGFRCPGFQRTQHFELFITNRIGVCVDRWLHANRAQQLQRVVLHHVTQCAGVFVKRTA